MFAPFALSLAEGAEIAAACRAAGVCVMEAMWTRYLPQSDIISQLLADGVIGEIDLVLADFGFAAPFDPQGRMWDPELGGGALLDAGVYPLSFASSVIGKPSRIVANGALTSTGVDARAAIALTTPGGANALIATSMVSSLPVRATIVGSAGRIDVPSPFFGPDRRSADLRLHPLRQHLVWKDHSFETLHEGLSYQATAMASYVAEGRSESPLHTLDETVSILATIDEARRQIAAAGNANRSEPAPGRRR